jgi:hypothetical protein
MMNLADTLLGIGRVALESVHGRTVTYEGATYTPVGDDTEALRAKRRNPDVDLKVGTIFEIPIAQMLDAPVVGRYIEEENGRSHRIKERARIGLNWRIVCEPSS